MAAKPKTKGRKAMENTDRKPSLKPSCKLRKAGKPIEINLLSSSESDDSPIRAIVCLRRIEDIKRLEETEDCFILEFDPFHSVDLSKLSLNKDQAADEDAADLSIIAEKGKVACRDYPHPRHLCLKFPFEKTPHESYCEMCYCYVCDSAAPCKYWTQPLAAHCNAENIGRWKGLRELRKRE